MDYCYNDLVQTCNVTRIYPHGCCPHDFKCQCSHEQQVCKDNTHCDAESAQTDE